VIDALLLEYALKGDGYPNAIATLLLVSEKDRDELNPRPRKEIDVAFLTPFMGGMPRVRFTQ